MSGEMTEREKILRTIEAWKEAEPMLEKDRIERIRNTDVERGIRSFAGILTMYLARNGFRKTSGLVELQSLFSLQSHD